MITHQLLLKDWHRLKELDDEGMNLDKLHPTNSIVIICEDNGEILGLAALVLVTHLEPVWVRPDKRGRGVFQRLISHIHSKFPQLDGVVSHTSNPRVAGLMEAYGLLHLVDVKVFKLQKKQEERAQ